MENKKKYSLSDSDIVTTTENQSERPAYWTKMSSVMMALAIGGTMVSCSDEKSCTDANVTDYGYYIGNTYYVDSNVADPAGAGDACRDYD